MVKKHLTNNNWREVFLLIAGLLPGRKGADLLLLSMEKQARSLINTPKLNALLQWAEHATSGSEGNYKPVAKRAAAIVLARARAREFEKIKIFKSVNFAKLVADLNMLKFQVPDQSQPIEVRRAFVDRIHEVWFDAIGLDRETAMLSKDEVKPLTDYLYACELMVRCQEAAVRVSPQIWEAIEGRMLTVEADVDSRDSSGG